MNADGYVNANEDLIGFNMYAYCSNNPVMHVDPNGEELGTLIILGILGLATIVGGAIGHSVGHDDGKRGWDLVLSTIKGDAAGLALGGAVTAASSAVAIGAVGTSATFLGVSLPKIFAYGALAYNSVACLMAPLLGIEMEPIEYGTPAPSSPNHMPDFSPHPAQ